MIQLVEVNRVTIMVVETITVLLQVMEVNKVVVIMAKANVHLVAKFVVLIIVHNIMLDHQMTR